MHHLYCITIHTNNKKYIGQTIDPVTRWRQHIREAKKDIPSMIINRAMKKHCFTDGYFDINKCSFNIVACSLTQESANYLEELLIQQENSHISNRMGYNVSAGGSTAAKTTEWKQKVSISLMGHEVLPETRHKLSIAHTGKVLSEETKIKIGIGSKGRIKTPETCQKLSEANKGNKNCLGKKNALGYKHTNEAKQKISEASKARPSPTKGKTWKLINGKRVYSKTTHRRSAASIEKGRQTRIDHNRDIAIIECYLNGQNISDIEKQFSTSRSSIYRIIQRNNIPLQNNFSKWTGRKHSKETKEKMSQAAIEKWNNIRKE